jgi:hypothetical protein
MHVSGGAGIYLKLLREKSAGDSLLPFIFNGDFSYGLKLLLKNSTFVFVLLILGSIAALPLLLSNKLWVIRFLNARSKFLLVWLCPGVLLHCLTTVGHSGYVLTYLPAALLLLSGMILPEENDEGAAVALAPKRFLLLAGIGLQSSFFLFIPQQYWPPSGPGHWITDTVLRSEIVEPTRSRIVEYDSTLKVLIEEIKHRFPQKETMLIVAVGDETPRMGGIRPFYAQGKYYLPGYEQRVLYTTDQVPVFKKFGMTGSWIAEVTAQDFRLSGTNVVNVPSRIRWLVWFCDIRRQPYPFDAPWVRQPLPSGSSLVFADLNDAPQVALHWGPFEFRYEMLGRGSAQSEKRLDYR